MRRRADPSHSKLLRRVILHISELQVSYHQGYEHGTAGSATVQGMNERKRSHLSSGPLRHVADGRPGPRIMAAGEIIVTLTIWNTLEREPSSSSGQQSGADLGGNGMGKQGLRRWT